MPKPRSRPIDGRATMTAVTSSWVRKPAKERARAGARRKELETFFMGCSDAAPRAKDRTPSIHLGMNIVHTAVNAFPPALRRPRRLRHRAPPPQHDAGRVGARHDAERRQPSPAPARSL